MYHFEKLFNLVCEEHGSSQTYDRLSLQGRQGVNLIVGMVDKLIGHPLRAVEGVVDLDLIYDFLHTYLEECRANALRKADDEGEILRMQKESTRDPIEVFNEWKALKARHYRWAEEERKASG